MKCTHSLRTEAPAALRCRVAAKAEPFYTNTRRSGRQAVRNAASGHHAHHSSGLTEVFGAKFGHKKSDIMDVPPGSGVDAALVPPPPPPPPADASPAVEAAAASAPAAPPAAPSTTPAVPVLKGVVSVVGARYVFRGVWAMAEADSVVSDFEYVSRDLVSAASSAAAAAAAAASAVVANGDKAGLDINGAHADAGAGAGSDAVAADTVPPNGEYDGFFMLKRVGLPELKVEERGMLFRWTRPAVPPLVPAGVEPPPPSTDAPASVEPSRASPTAASGSESESESEQPPPPPPPADGGGVPAAAPAPVSASAAAAVVSPRPQSTIPLPGDFSFFASGSNIFGSFDLCGRYDPVSRQLVCSKVYTALPPTSPLAIIGKPSKSRKSSSKKRSGGEPRPRPVGPPRPKVVKPPPPVTPVLVDMAATPTPMLGDDMLTDAQRCVQRSASLVETRRVVCLLVQALSVCVWCVLVGLLVQGTPASNP
jgi:hypothetical protein